jgi:hypothetical protein
MKTVRNLFKSSPMYLGLLGVGGSVTMLYYRQRLDSKLDHPLVKESLRIMETNPDITEMIGQPLSVQSTLRSRASIGVEVCSFSYKVQGPRGSLDIELAGCASEHQKIGPDKYSKGKLKEVNAVAIKHNKALKDNKSPSMQVYENRDNLDEFNYADYYV